MLTIAVLVILITAPLGAIGIAVSGPRLLTKTNKSIQETEVISLDNKYKAGENESIPLKQSDSLANGMQTKEDMNV